MKEITLKMTGYKIEGVVKILDWYNNEGYIKMSPSTLSSLPNDYSTVLNDNGFGCQKILGGIIYIFEVYEGYNKMIEEKVIGDFNKESINI